MLSQSESCLLGVMAATYSSSICSCPGFPAHACVLCRPCVWAMHALLGRTGHTMLDHTSLARLSEQPLLLPDQVVCTSLLATTCTAPSCLHPSREALGLQHVTGATTASWLYKLPQIAHLCVSIAGKQCRNGCVLTSGHQCHSRLPVQLFLHPPFQLSPGWGQGCSGLLAQEASGAGSQHTNSHPVRYTCLSYERRVMLRIRLGHA